MNKKILCIYHGNCADGFTAAWAVWLRFGEEVEFYPGVYQSPPPDVTGRRVIIVDFSYKRAVMAEIAHKAASVLVLDHHKSADEDLAEGRAITGDHSSSWIFRMDKTYKGALSWERHLTDAEIDRCEGCPTSIYCYFDMDRSGAGIAWDFFHPGVQRPKLIDHVEDRDLWRFKIPGTREIQAAVFSYPYDFVTWTRLSESFDGFGQSSLLNEGAAIERKHHKDVAELVKVCKRRMVMGGVDVPVASLPYTLVSDAGHLMAQGEPFAACYWDAEGCRHFGLRSTDDGMDVSLIASMYGGGGHKNAAGFKVPRDHELAKA
jgi:uncharacterized protein